MNSWSCGGYGILSACRRDHRFVIYVANGLTDQPLHRPRWVSLPFHSRLHHTSRPSLSERNGSGPQWRTFSQLFSNSDSKTWTYDLSFTKALLYQLSYVGKNTILTRTIEKSDSATKVNGVLCLVWRSRISCPLLSRTSSIRHTADLGCRHLPICRRGLYLLPPSMTFSSANGTRTRIAALKGRWTRPVIR